MSDTPLLAFHGSLAIKRKYLKRVRTHRRADELIRGTGWDGHRGCAVGCTLEKYEHQAYETELGIPVVLAHLEDAIFEGLPQDLAMDWPERFLTAIKPGKDLSLVSAHFMVWMLEDLLSEWASDQSCRIVALYKRRIAGDEPTDTEWEAAAWAARAAAWAARAAARAAWAATWAAAEVAAWAAEAAEVAAWAAAWAARAAAEAAAEVASYTKMADKLIDLLEAA